MTTDWVAGQEVTADDLNNRATITVLYAAITSNTGTTTTAEATAITAGGVTFKNGRAYRINIKALIQSSIAADTVTMRVRQNTTSGNTYLDTQRIYIPVASANVLYCGFNIITNTTGADVVATAMLLDYLRASGTGNVLIAASTSQVAYLHIEEIGAATDFPSATAIS